MSIDFTVGDKVQWKQFRPLHQHILRNAVILAIGEKKVRIEYPRFEGSTFVRTCWVKPGTLKKLNSLE